MTAVYSGGLVYEYSEEGSGYGLVKISGNSASQLDDFKTLQDKYSKTPIPTSDGGYKQDGAACECPAKSSTWEVDDSDGLPAMPEPAKKYFEKGAGKGPGLTGSGSQWAGTQSTGTVTGSSSSASSTGSSSTSHAAAATVRAPEWDVAPFVCMGVVMASTLFGATLL